jgi:hypothetical protein
MVSPPLATRLGQSKLTSVFSLVSLRLNPLYAIDNKQLTDDK